MNRYEKILESMILGADLPGEAIPGQPLIEISGDHRVLIENHRGVTVYGPKEIQIGVCFGRICFCGDCLKIAYMSRQQLVIVGKIDCITIKRVGR